MSSPFRAPLAEYTDQGHEIEEMQAGIKAIGRAVASLDTHGVDEHGRITWRKPETRQKTPTAEDRMTAIRADSQIDIHDVVSTEYGFTTDPSKLREKQEALLESITHSDRYRERGLWAIATTEPELQKHKIKPADWKEAIQRQTQRTFAISRLHSQGIKRASDLVAYLENSPYLRQMQYAEGDEARGTEKISYDPLSYPEVVLMLKSLDAPVVALERIRMLAPRTTHIGLIAQFSAGNKALIQRLNQLSAIPEEEFARIYDQLIPYEFLRPDFHPYATHSGVEDTVIPLLEIIEARAIEPDLKQKLELAQQYYQISGKSIRLRRLVEYDTRSLQSLLALSSQGYRPDIEVQGTDSLDAFIQSQRQLTDAGLEGVVETAIANGFEFSKERVSQIANLSELEPDKQEETVAYLKHIQDAFTDPQRFEWLLMTVQSRRHESISDETLEQATRTYQYRQHILASAALALPSLPQNPRQRQENFSQLLFETDSALRAGRNLFEDLDGFEPDPLFLVFCRKWGELDPALLRFTNASSGFYRPEVLAGYYAQYQHLVEMYQQLDDLPQREKTEAIASLSEVAELVVGDDQSSALHTARCKTNLANYWVQDPESAQKLFDQLPRSPEEYQAFLRAHKQLEERLGNCSIYSPIGTLAYRDSITDALRDFESLSYLMDNVDTVLERFSELGLSIPPGLNEQAVRTVIDLCELRPDEVRSVAELIEQNKFGNDIWAAKKCVMYIRNQEGIDYTQSRLEHFFDQQADVHDPGDFFHGNYLREKLSFLRDFDSIATLAELENIDEVISVAQNLWQYGFKADVTTLLNISRILENHHSPREFLNVCYYFQELSGAPDFYSMLFHDQLQALGQIADMNPVERADLYAFVDRLRDMGLTVSCLSIPNILELFNDGQKEELISAMDKFRTHGVQFSFEGLTAIRQLRDAGLYEGGLETAHRLHEELKLEHPDMQFIATVAQFDDINAFITTTCYLQERAGLTPDFYNNNQKGGIQFIKEIADDPNREQILEACRIAYENGYYIQDTTVYRLRTYAEDPLPKEGVLALMKKLDARLNQGMTLENYPVAAGIYQLIVEPSADPPVDRTEALLQAVDRLKALEITINYENLEKYAATIVTKGLEHQFEEAIQVLAQAGFNFQHLNVEALTGYFLSPQWKAVSEALNIYISTVTEPARRGALFISELNTMIEAARAGILPEDIGRLVSELRQDGRVRFDVLRPFFTVQIYENPAMLGVLLERNRAEIISAIQSHGTRFEAFPQFAKAFIPYATSKDPAQAFTQTLVAFNRYPIHETIWQSQRAVVTDLLTKAGPNAQYVLETASRKEGFRPLELLNFFSNEALIALDNPDDIASFKSYIHEIGAFASPMIFAAYRYLDQGEKGDFPEALSMMGLTPEAPDKKTRFTAEVQRGIRGIVLSGSLTGVRTKLDEEILRVAMRFETGRFRRSGTEANLGSIILTYRQGIEQGRIAPMGDIYQPGEFDLQMITGFEVSSSAVEQAHRLQEQAQTALELINRPPEEIIRKYSVILKEAVEEKVQGMRTGLEQAQANFNQRRAERPEGFDEEKELRSLNIRRQNVERDIAAYEELLRRSTRFEQLIQQPEALGEQESEELLSLLGFSDKQTEQLGKHVGTSSYIPMQYLRMLLNFESLYFSKKGSPPLGPTISSLVMLHCLQNVHQMNLSVDLHEELRKLATSTEISIAIISGLAEFVDTVIREHSINIADLTPEQRQRAIAALNIASLQEDIHRHAVSETENHEKITVVPTRDLLELIGDISDACTVRTPKPADQYPDLTGVIFVKDAEDPTKTEAVGGAYIAETTIGGQPALIMRGTNPQQELFDKGGSPLSFLQEYLDRYLVPHAQRLGLKKGTEEVLIVTPRPGTNAFSNRSPLTQVFGAIATEESVVLDKPFDFNHYDITQQCVVVRHVKVERQSE